MPAVKSFFLRSITALLTVNAALWPLTGEAYDLSHSTLRKSPSSPFSVALVPFAEVRTRSLEALMKRLDFDLKRTKGVRVMPRGDTDEILSYYLKYINGATGSDSIQASLTEARQSLLAGNYAQAEERLTAAERRIGAAVVAGGSNEGLYQIHLLRAKIHHARNRKQAVAVEYDRLVALHPTLELDANLYSSWERKALAAAKGRISSDDCGSIRVTATPQGSEVFLNGVHRGIAPMTLRDLPAGEHVVEVKTVHHAPFVQRLNLKPRESRTLSALLARTGVAGAEAEAITIRPSHYGTDLEISKLISTLGYHLGVDRIVLVSDKSAGGIDSLLYRIGDTGLGSVQRQHEASLTSESPKEGVSEIVEVMNKEIRTDILKDPPRYADQSVGSVKLHEVRRRPLYKKPLFWVLVGAAAGTGGALAAVLAPGAAAGGILIGF